MNNESFETWLPIGATVLVMIWVLLLIVLGGA